MKAIRYHGPGKLLKLEDIPCPVPGPGEALIKVKSAGICHTELHFLSGLLNLGVAPITLGHEIAGVVEEIGVGVDQSLLGKRGLVYYYQGCGKCRFCLVGQENLCDHLVAEHGFITDGGFAEFIKVPARNVVPLPSHISDETAAPIGCSVTTAVHASHLVDIHLGGNVVVYGIGGVGLGVVQLAHLSGANVIAIGRTKTKLDKARELGAAHVINAKTDNVPERIRELTNGKGADIIFELVGTRETMDNSIKSIAKHGDLVFIGYSQDSLVVHPISLVITEARVTGSVGNTLSELYEAVQLVADGKIKTVIDRVLKLEDYQRGIDALQKGEPVGRIILNP
jgi:alcohol dehydrogenase, propanol-preferring